MSLPGDEAFSLCAGKAFSGAAPALLVYSYPPPLDASEYVLLAAYTGSSPGTYASWLTGCLSLS